MRESGVRPRRIDERVDEDELVDEVGMRGRQRERDGAPHARARTARRARGRGGDEIDQRLGEAVEVVAVPARGRLLALAEARQIGRDDPKRAGEAGEHVVPGDAAREVVVDEHERRPAPGLDEPDASAARGDVARGGLRGPTLRGMARTARLNIGRRRARGKRRRAGPSGRVRLSPHPLRSTR